MGFLEVFRFPPTSHERTSRWICYSKSVSFYLFAVRKHHWQDCFAKVKGKTGTSLSLLWVFRTEDDHALYDGLFFFVPRVFQIIKSNHKSRRENKVSCISNPMNCKIPRVGVYCTRNFWRRQGRPSGGRTIGRLFWLVYQCWQVYCISKKEWFDECHKQYLDRAFITLIVVARCCINGWNMTDMFVCICFVSVWAWKVSCFSVVSCLDSCLIQVSAHVYDACGYY